MLGFERDIIDFDTFSQKVKKALESKLSDNSEIVIRPITKLNGVILHGISIKRKDKCVVPVLYLEDFFESYNEGTTLTYIVERMLEVLDSDTGTKELDIDFFSDYKTVKGQLGIKLINAKNNKELLEDVPHKMFLDLAIVCYVAVRNQAIGSGSILIHNNHIMMWGISEKELIFDAIENVSRIEPGRMCKITEMLGNILDDLDVDQKEAGNEMLDDSPVDLLVLTNESRMFGASVLVYKGMLESIARSVKSDYYIIPSSIHEVLILPITEQANYESLNCMVREVNSTQLQPVEILSDHVYMYSREKRQLMECNA